MKKKKMLLTDCLGGAQYSCSCIIGGADIWCSLSFFSDLGFAVDQTCTLRSSMQYFQCKASQQCDVVWYQFTTVHSAVLPTLTKSWKQKHFRHSMLRGLLLKNHHDCCARHCILEQFGQLQTKGSGGAQRRLVVVLSSERAAGTWSCLGGNQWATQYLDTEQQSGCLTCETRHCSQPHNTQLQSNLIKLSAFLNVAAEHVSQHGDSYLALVCVNPLTNRPGLLMEDSSYLTLTSFKRVRHCLLLWY